MNDSFDKAWTITKEGDEPWAKCECGQEYSESEMEELDAFFEAQEMGSECFNCGGHAGDFTGRLNLETYEVALAQTVFWLLTVEAESPEHAEEVAKDNAGMDQVSEGGKIHVDSVKRIK